MTGADHIAGLQQPRRQVLNRHDVPRDPWRPARTPRRRPRTGAGLPAPRAEPAIWEPGGTPGPCAAGIGRRPVYARGNDGVQMHRDAAGCLHGSIQASGRLQAAGRADPSPSGSGQASSSPIRAAARSCPLTLRVRRDALLSRQHKLSQPAPFRRRREQRHESVPKGPRHRRRQGKQGAGRGREPQRNARLLLRADA